ncbi:MAG: hypothetical protein U1E05_15575, partial [Patescibacteria group bacterium]|nr:hypothetical protein [Patescibacteria group bacterium]
PSVHQMIVKLEENGLITREPGVARSIRVTVPHSEIPPLDDEEDAIPRTVYPRVTKRAGKGPSQYSDEEK